MAEESIVLIDGSSLAFRSFYALIKSGLRSSTGMPTWAVLGFFNALFDLMEKETPQMLAVCFDLEGPTFRHEASAEYKATRKEMPDELSVQWPLIKEGIKALEIPVLEIEGWEADDVIGTIAQEAKQKGYRVRVFTGDKDMFQLIEKGSEAISILVPIPFKGGFNVYGRQEVHDKLGVYPEQVPDYKGLCGDTSDNIPGVRGIGPKTASELLTTYGTLEGIYEHIDEIKSKSVKQKLSDGRESAFASKDLATIRLTVPVRFDFDCCRLTAPNAENVVHFFKTLEFKGIVNRLPKILARFDQLTGKEQTSESDMAKVVAAASAPASATASGAGGATASSVFAQQGSLFSAQQLQSFSRGGATTAVLDRVKLAPLTDPRLILNLAELDELIGQLQKCGVFSLDLQLGAGNALEADLYGIAFAWSPGLTIAESGIAGFARDFSEDKWQVETAFVPLKRSGLLAEDHLEQDVVCQRLKPVLEDATIGKIAANSKSAMHALFVRGVNLKPVIFDPVLASYIANTEDKHEINSQSERLLAYTVARLAAPSSGGKKITNESLPVNKLAYYGADDARVALELTKFYLDFLPEDQQCLFGEMELPLASVLARMEQNGVALDLPYLKQFSIELSNELTRLENEIYHLAGHSFNILSTHQLQKVLFEELKLQPHGKTEKKTGYSTAAAVLDELVNDHEIVPKILEFRQLAKLRSTYVDAFPKLVSTRDNRLHGTFNQTEARTGRLSSSDPNLQNIPIRTEIGRRIRRAFVPADKDSVLLSADYSQIELRMLAHMCADEILIDAFQKDQDIHARTSGEIFDVPFEEVTSDMRRIGKTLNFALIYQQGPYATAQDLGITTRQASAFIEKYFSRYPRVKGFLNRLIVDARDNGYVVTLWNRRRYFRNLNDRNDTVRKADERAACNAPIQGSAADLMKMAMIRLDKALQEKGLKSRLILQVHDELVLEVPKEEIEQAKQVVLESMQLEQPFLVPLKVDMGVGPNWMECK